MKKKTRFLSALLALALCLTCMALPAFAEEEEGCICYSACYPGFVNEDCPVCSAEGFTADQCRSASKNECICKDHCVDYRCAELRAPRCYYCWDYYKGNEERLRAACPAQGEPIWLTQCSCTGDQCTIKPRPNGSGYYIDEDGCWLCWYNTSYGYPSVCLAGGVSSSSSSSSSSGKSAPDISGRYRTTAARLREKLNPVTIAQQQLYIDEVTNTIFNLYDADGNLITATLSSDGHFYIVPDSSGEYVYIPTGR